MSSRAKRSNLTSEKAGLLRHYVPRKDGRGVYPLFAHHIVIASEATRSNRWPENLDYFVACRWVPGEPELLRRLPLSGRINGLLRHYDPRKDGVRLCAGCCTP